MRKAMNLALLLCFGAGVVLADHFGDFHFVPLAGHAPGIAGSMWQTDIVVHNFQTTPLIVEMGAQLGTGKI